MRGSLVMLTALTMFAVESYAEEALPAGFLEFLGGMVEVEEGAESTLLDPLDFEGLQDPSQTADGAVDDRVDDGTLHSGQIEEVLP